jgi:hypothetical protein
MFGRPSSAEAPPFPEQVYSAALSLAGDPAEVEDADSDEDERQETDDRPAGNR